MRCDPKRRFNSAAIIKKGCSAVGWVGGSRHYKFVRRLPHLSIDRCDVQFETNVCAKEMKPPTKAPWTRLKRLARYLAGTQSARVVLRKPGTDYDPHGAFLGVWSDNDWDGNVRDRKSQSSLKSEVGGCPQYSASRKHKPRAHSSGEN